MKTKVYPKYENCGVGWLRRNCAIINSGTTKKSKYVLSK